MDEIDRLQLTVDDLEKQRTLALRMSKQWADLLQDGLHALRHQRYEVTDEFMERAITGLNDLHDKMKWKEVS